MATAIIRPNGDNIVEWVVEGADHAWDALNDSVEQPDDPTELGGSCISDTLDDKLQVSFSTLTRVKEVTQLDLWAFVVSTHAGDQLDAYLIVDDIYGDPVITEAPGPDGGWVHGTLSGLSLSQSSLNGVAVELQHVETDYTILEVYAVYIVATYTPRRRSLIT